MQKRFKTIIAIGLTFATVLVSCVTAWASSTDVADVGTNIGNTSLVIENGGVKEELCAEHIVIEKYDDLIEYHSATHRINDENWKYAPDTYDGGDNPFISNCVILRVNADASFTIDAEHIVTIIQYTTNNSFYIQYDSEEAAEEAVKVLNEVEGIKYAEQNSYFSVDLEDSTEDSTQEPSSLPFTDVLVTDWFYPAVEALYNENIMIGPGNAFGPYESISRAQFAVILYRMEGSPEVEYSPVFSDIPDGSWYTDAVLWAASEGIVTGYADGSGEFRPAGTILREQMAVMLYRYAVFKGYDVTATADFSAFTDAADVSKYAEAAMKWAVGSGVITGKTEGTLMDSYGSASRAEAAVMIDRFMEKN